MSNDIWLNTFLFRKLDAIHTFAREGDTENLIKCVEGGIAVDMKGMLPSYFLTSFVYLLVGLLGAGYVLNFKVQDILTPIQKCR